MNTRKQTMATCHPERSNVGRGLCKQCYDRDYANKHRSKINASAREWSASHPESRRATRRKYLYGIDAATVQARLNAQDGLCRICGKTAATDLDHNHETDKARGMLCGDCNRALGLFKEEVASLRRAADYLELWDDRCVQVIQNTGIPGGH